MHTYLISVTPYTHLIIISDQTPIVKFGRSKTELDKIAEGKSQTYTANDFCSLQGKFIDPGYIHDVLLTRLEPSKVYYYSCGVSGVCMCEYIIISHILFILPHPPTFLPSYLLLLCLYQPTTYPHNTTSPNLYFST